MCVRKEIKTILKMVRWLIQPTLKSHDFAMTKNYSARFSSQFKIEKRKDHQNDDKQKVVNALLR